MERKEKFPCLDKGLGEGREGERQGSNFPPSLINTIPPKLKRFGGEHGVPSFPSFLSPPLPSSSSFPPLFRCNYPDKCNSCAELFQFDVYL